MIKKTIQYTDLDGGTVVEDFYFNLTKAELMELEALHEGGFSKHLESIVSSQNPRDILQTFKKILLMSVGKRSEDGRRFIKTDSIRDEFESSLAYSELYMSLMSNETEAAAFIRGIVPPDLAKQVKAEVDKRQESPQVERVPRTDIPQEDPPEPKPLDTVNIKLNELPIEEQQKLLQQYHMSRPAHESGPGYTAG